MKRLNKKEWKKTTKYIAGSAGAVSLAVASCVAGITGSTDVTKYDKEYLAGDDKASDTDATTVMNTDELADTLVYGAFDRIANETGKEALEVFDAAMNNIMPSLEVKARRIGGATYQVPIEVRPDRRQALALRWLTTYSRARSEKTMEERLAKELMDAANNTGASVKRKEDMHKMAEANKAFAHYRF